MNYIHSVICKKEGYLKYTLRTRKITYKPCDILKYVFYIRTHNQMLIGSWIIRPVEIQKRYETLLSILKFSLSKKK